MCDVPAGLAAEWMEFYRLEPWGEARADARGGIIAAEVCNLLSVGAPYRPDMFFYPDRSVQRRPAGDDESVDDTFDVATALLVMDHALFATTAPE